MILIKIHNYLANDDDPTIDGYLMYSIRQNIIMSCTMIKIYLYLGFCWLMRIFEFIQLHFDYYYIIRGRYSNYKSINDRLRWCAWLNLLFTLHNNLIGQSLIFLSRRSAMMQTPIIIHIFDTRIRVSFQCFLFLLEYNNKETLISK